MDLRYLCLHRPISPFASASLVAWKCAKLRFWSASSDSTLTGRPSTRSNLRVPRAPPACCELERCPSFLVDSPHAATSRSTAPAPTFTTSSTLPCFTASLLRRSSSSSTLFPSALSCTLQSETALPRPSNTSSPTSSSLPSPLRSPLSNLLEAYFLCSTTCPPSLKLSSLA